MKKYKLSLLFFSLLLSSQLFSQNTQIYFNPFFSNWTYDSTNNIFILQDYQSGVKRLHPKICDITFDTTKRNFYISGRILYPGKKDEPVAQSKIIYALLSNNDKLKFVTTLGFTDSSGNFSFKMADPSSKFYLLFSKEKLFSAAVEFNLPDLQKRKNWTSTSELCNLNGYNY